MMATDLDRVCKTVQFVTTAYLLNEIDNQEYVERMKEIGKGVVQGEYEL